jgi:excinuclease ABC subunit C
MDLSSSLKKTLRELPDKPGCYLMRDRNGTIIYVGKATSLRRRVQSYFRDGTLRKGTPKLLSMVKSIYAIDVIVVHNEAAALLTEGKLIKQYKPRYNVSFRDDKRFLLLRANPEEPFPRFRLVRLRRDDGARYFGPYASSQAARGTLDFIEKHFGLRKCTPRVPDEETYKHCINDVVRFCSAPCIGKIDAETYNAAFEEACEFLRGRRPELLRKVRAQMKEAAAALKFEKAATLRDTLLSLERAVKQHARMQQTPKMKKEAAVHGIEQVRDLLGLAEVPHIIECFDISNISGTYAVGSMVCAVDGIPTPSRYRRFRIKTIEGSDDPAMMAEVIRRRYSRLQEEAAEMPGLILVDGGITQLHAARAELALLGLDAVPSAGLAKQFEELHIDDGRPAARLPRGSDAFNVLTRLRDEAHRFAITYHRTLRNKRLRESVLDEVDGIGDKRKLQLLRHFGSVGRLKAASLKEIQAVPGFGKVAAQKIHDVLHTKK